MNQKAKKGQDVLFIPGAGGWQVWSGDASAELVLAENSSEREALSVENVPKGNLTIAFPVRDVSAAPFLAATGEEAMFEDLAELHLERSGLRGSEASGSLTDCFTLRTGEEEALLLPVVLSPPPEGGLPKRSPQNFDISARCFPMPPQAVVLWREFGRWVFAVSDEQSQPLYFQALPGALFDQQLTREVSLSLAQLEMQQVLTEHPRQCLIWSGEEEIAPAAEGVTALEQALAMSVEVAEKPTPRLPKTFSHLLPSDIRAERVARRKSTQVKLAAVVGILLYLGTIAFFALKFQDLKEKKTLAEQRAETTSPAAAEAVAFTEKWEELQPVVENDYWPIEQYFQAYQAAPKTGLRIERAEMRNEFQVQDGEGQVLKRSIILRGNSDEVRQAVQFGENLKRTSYFDAFSWNIPSPTQANTGAWDFIYTATLPSSNS